VSCFTCLRNLKSSARSSLVTPSLRMTAVASANVRHAFMNSAEGTDRLAEGPALVSSYGRKGPLAKMRHTGRALLLAH
jgi:hypothetical protein